MSYKKTVVVGFSLFGLVVLTALSTFYVSLGESAKSLRRKIEFYSSGNCEAIKSLPFTPFVGFAKSYLIWDFTEVMTAS